MTRWMLGVAVAIAGGVAVAADPPEAKTGLKVGEKAPDL